MVTDIQYKLDRQYCLTMLWANGLYIEWPEHQINQSMSDLKYK